MCCDSKCHGRGPLFLVNVKGVGVEGAAAWD